MSGASGTEAAGCFVPLTTADALDLDRWKETPITFKALC
jgi:hypothetical protein